MQPDLSNELDRAEKHISQLYDKIETLQLRIAVLEEKNSELKDAIFELEKPNDKSR